jgi:molybdate transport system substrate-binding protein
MRKIAFLTVIAVIAAATISSGCRKPGAKAADPAAPQAGVLHIAVPCGLAGPYGDLKKLFQEKNPGVTVTQELVNIAPLTRAIADGQKTPDAFISLGDQEVKVLQAAGRIDGEPVSYGYQKIALIVLKNNPCNIESLQDLATDKVKTIALATEANSVGYYAKQSLQRSGIWDKIQGKLWMTDEPADMKMQVSSGKADCAFIYGTCQQETHKVGDQPSELPGKVQPLGALPPDTYEKFTGQVVVVKGAANPMLGRAFADFMTTPEAKKVWRKWGFGLLGDDKQTALYVYCGAGLRPAMDAIQDAFEESHPDLRLEVGYAGSGCLLSQLTFAQRGDLYVPGEDFYVNQAKERGFIKDSKVVGELVPVILVQKGNPKGIKTLQDLAKPGLSLAIGEPEAVAIGRTAMAMFKAAGIEKQIEPNVKVRVANVIEIGNDIKLGHIDAGVVWNITAAQFPKDTDAVEISAELRKPSPVPVGVLTFSKAPDAAQKVLDFMASDEGRQILVDHGLAAPPAAGGK